MNSCFENKWCSVRDGRGFCLSCAFRKTKIKWVHTQEPFSGFVLVVAFSSLHVVAGIFTFMYTSCHRMNRMHMNILFEMIWYTQCFNHKVNKLVSVGQAMRTLVTYSTNFCISITICVNEFCQLLVRGIVTLIRHEFQAIFLEFGTNAHCLIEISTVEY